MAMENVDNLICRCCFSYQRGKDFALTCEFPLIAMFVYQRVVVMFALSMLVRVKLHAPASCKSNDAFV